jgi:hypothetical protein
MRLGADLKLEWQLGSARTVPPEGLSAGSGPVFKFALFEAFPGVLHCAVAEMRSECPQM